MTKRVWLFLVSLAVALGVTAPAQAGTQSPKITSSPIHLCLGLRVSECFVADGGNQAIINSSGASTITAHQTATGVWVFEDAHGNCIRGGNNNEVKTALCDYADDPEQKWIEHDASNGTFEFENYGHRGNYMGTFGTASFNLVYYQGKQTGFDVGWFPEPA